ncbi:MFS transporter [Herminiimonas sp. KBW02]|uniref:MFS transporter n=1 Tax=Herminiimonas sp. KBW02 TaxID=2153363 RepID=UPI000F5A1089|nr:MFS transporter [Herminiimonas sp. KBW02]RQO35888.1 MFS transporter [Herminiimonas sp. KBW02]
MKQHPTAPASATTAQLASPALLLSGILLIAMNLRVPFTSVAPLIDGIRSGLSLSSSAAGLLITLPLLAFAVVSPFGSFVAKKFGIERSLLAALLIIAAGILLRSTGTAWALYLGTWIIGSGIAIGNVLLPGLLKRSFPDQITKFTAIYVLTMGVASALGSVCAVPLAQLSDYGWRFAMGALIVLPLLSALIWLPQLKRHTEVSTSAPPPYSGPIWHSALAWQVSLFLGLNSFVYYIMTTWLPTMLTDAGYSAAEAGNLHGLMQFSAATPGLLVVPLVSRFRDQRGIAFGASLLTVISIVGLMFVPGLAALWTCVFGFSAGATLILGLAFVSLRASSSLQAAALSGMAQCIGYTLAAIGPILIGKIHDAQGNWHATLLISASAAFLMALFGLYAGRNLHIGKRA